MRIQHCELGGGLSNMEGGKLEGSQRGDLGWPAISVSYSGVLGGLCANCPLLLPHSHS